MCHRFADGFDPELGILVPALGRPLGLGQGVFQGLDIGQHQLDLDRLDVRDRVDGPRHMDDVGILEASDDLDDRLDLADMAEELVAEPFTLARPLDDPGDIHEAERRRDELLGDDVLADPRQAIVGDADDPFVRLDRAKGIIRALGGLGARQHVEQSALAHVR